MTTRETAGQPMWVPNLLLTEDVASFEGSLGGWDTDSGNSVNPARDNTRALHGEWSMLGVAFRDATTFRYRLRDFTVITPDTPVVLMASVWKPERRRCRVWFRAWPDVVNVYGPLIDVQPGEWTKLVQTIDAWPAGTERVDMYVSCGDDTGQNPDPVLLDEQVWIECCGIFETTDPDIEWSLPGALPPDPPVLDTLTPARIVANVPTTVTARGENFIPSSQVWADETAQATTFVNGTTLTWPAQASEAGSQRITVRNGSDVSNVVDLLVEPAPPIVLDRLDPDRITEGDASRRMLAHGSGFKVSSRVFVDASNRATTFVDAGTLDYAGPSAGGEAGRRYVITVRHDDQVSNELEIVVDPPPTPVLDRLEPNRIVAEDSPRIITADGSGFVAVSQVWVDGVAVATTFVDDATLRWAAQTNQLGGQSITVRHGSEVSNALILAVSPAPRPPLPPRGERSSWLVLGANKVMLEDLERGWVLTRLDLGFPEMREVVRPVPDAHGVDDTTKLAGARAVTADLVAFPTEYGLALDEIVHQFAPFMVPAARPELHFTDFDGRQFPLERKLTLRPVGMTAPMGHPTRRDFQLAWSAPDPVIYNAVGESHTIGFPGGPWPTVLQLATAGEIPIPPVVRVYGPVGNGSTDQLRIWFAHPTLGTRIVTVLGNVVIADGAWLEFDAGKNTVRDNLGNPRNELVDWMVLAWPVISPRSTGLTQVNVFGGGFDPQKSRATVTFAEGWLW